MKTLAEVKGRCRIEDGHWIWTGAVTADGAPRLWAPDYTTKAGEPCGQVGRRAVWHIKTGKPIPNGERVFGECDEPLCLNPDHAVCKTEAERGAEVAASGKWKGQVKRIAASRATCRARSNVSPALIAEVLASKETGVQLSHRLGVKRQTISKIRTGQMLAFQAVGGVFSGLLAANDSQRRKEA